MLKIFKYLNNSILAILLIIILLVLQAICDLSLPEYTSKIVNVGIQQEGIENACPNLIRVSEMDKVLLLTEKGDKILENFTLSGDEIYRLNKVDKETLDELNEIFSKALFLIYSINASAESGAEGFEKIKGQLPEGFTYLNQDAFEILRNIPDEKRIEFLIAIYQQIEEGMSEAVIEQIAMQVVKSEYEAIGIDTDKMQINYIVNSGVQMLGIALASMALAILVTLISARVAAKLAKNLRSKVFKKVVKFSNKEFEEFSTASLITRSTNDIQQIQLMLTMLFRIVVYSPIIGIGAFLKVLNSNSEMEWILALAIVAIFSLVITLFIIAMPKFKKMQTLIDRVNLVAREILTGLPVIRAFANRKHEEKRFDKANIDLTKTNLFVNRAMAFMMPTMAFIMNGVSILIIWVGSSKIDQGMIQVGDMMAFIQYSMQMMMSFLMISMISILLPRASVSAKRILEVLDTKNSIKDPKDPKKFDSDKKGYLEFRDVYFRYHNAQEDVLSNVSFIAKPGETTAIIGSTGSGKSTLVNLIPRFFDVTGGKILVNGVDIREVTQYDLREKIGFVPQKGVLFSGTIESNIKYGNVNLSDEEMKKIAHISQSEDFINEKENKYQDEIAQGGNNVSGGQKQRLAIARAIAKNPEIYVFDDSFSALDYKTDMELRKALKEETHDSTVIIVAQRISTILHAEQIVVLDEGRVCGIGTHKELMESCPVYSDIALSQLSKEELE